MRPFRVTDRGTVMRFALLAATIGLALAAALPARAEGPEFTVAPSWPKPLPNNWILGQVAGIAVDAQDHVWIIQRPGSLTDDEKGAALTPPRSKCCVPAPPVIVFDSDGNVLKSWGGKGAGYDWPSNEHGIRIDTAGNAWIGGNGMTDGMALKFTGDGKFLMQLGKAATLTGSTDTTQLGRPADFAIDPRTGDLFIADGYFNHRVIVFDANTGAFKRQWGAYGKPPGDQMLPNYNPTSPQFANPVHCVKLANDGLVYVCDRSNNRLQVFRTDGTFVREFAYETKSQGSGSVWDLALWPDRNQTYLVMVDGTNNEMRVIRRGDGVVVGTYGRPGRPAGAFHWVHNIAIDGRGNVYTTEVDTGKRVQKWTPNMAPAR
jgi:hypothetical protein